MKNKKGNKNQKFIAQVEKQVKSGGDPRARKIEEERALEKKRKEEAKKEAEEKKALFRPVMTQKVENGKTCFIKITVHPNKCPQCLLNWSPNLSDLLKIFNFWIPGVDPKSVFCAFFKQGLCKKGDKCKFSHDPDIERKAAKRNVYEQKPEEEDDNMEDWDDEKLAEVVAKKHAAEKTNETTIVRIFIR